MISRRELINNCNILLKKGYCDTIQCIKCPFGRELIDTHHYAHLLPEPCLKKYVGSNDRGVCSICKSFNLKITEKGLSTIKRVRDYLSYSYLDEIEELLND